MAKVYFPSTVELKDGIIEALKALGGSGTTKEINDKVIEIMKLPDEVVELEDENNLCTKLSYSLRWCRTDLKNRGLIESVERGKWKLV